MHPRERLQFSAITKRPPLRFPQGIRLVVWPVLALEEWDISRPMARMVISPPQGQPQLPDFPNWSWHEYGMRVGFWRLESMFRRLGAAPTVGVLMAFQIARRAGEFAVAKPAREVLFTAAPRPDRYKAKNFIDTFVYRAGDQLSAWAYSALVAAGLTVAGTSAVAVALALVSIALAVWLGRRQVHEARQIGRWSPRITAPSPAAADPHGSA